MAKEQIEQAANDYAKDCIGDYSPELQQDFDDVKGHFLAGASFASPAVSGMKWIKASERLPDKGYSFGNDEFGCFPVRWEFEYRTILGVGYLNQDDKVNPIYNSYNMEPFTGDLEWLDESLESPSTPSDNDFTFPFAKDKNGRWFYSYKDVNGLNQHSKSFDFYNHALEDYAKMRMVDETSAPVQEGEAVELDFANWILTEGYKPRTKTDWCIYRTHLSDIEVYTTEQLHLLFKKRK